MTPTYLSFVTFSSKNGVDFITHYIKFSCPFRMFYVFATFSALKKKGESHSRLQETDKEKQFNSRGAGTVNPLLCSSPKACSQKQTNKDKKKTSSLASQQLCSTDSGKEVGKGWGDTYDIAKRVCKKILGEIFYETSTYFKKLGSVQYSTL